jgi:hypothetical protein
MALSAPVLRDGVRRSHAFRRMPSGGSAAAAPRQDQLKELLARSAS